MSNVSNDMLNEVLGMSNNPVKNETSADTQATPEYKKPVFVSPQGFWPLLKKTAIVNEVADAGTIFKKKTTKEEEWVNVSLPGFISPVLLIFRGSNNKRIDGRKVGYVYIKDEKFNKVSKLTLVVKLTKDGKYASNDEVSAAGLLVGPATQTLPAGWGVELEFTYPRVKDAEGKWTNEFTFFDKFETALLNYLIDELF